MVELMLGLVLTMAVGGVTYSLLLNSSRVSRAQNEKVGMQDNVRSGALIIANELREIGYDNVTAAAQASMGWAPAVTNRSDLLELFQGTLKYNATRGLGFACATTTAAPYKVRVVQSTWQAYRAAKSTDSLMVYVENASSTAADDAWIHLGVSGAPASVNCPSGVPGWEFTVTTPANMTAAQLTTALTTGTHVVLGGPVRLTETMRMSHYQAADGNWWLGMKTETPGAALEPVVGPLTDSSTANHGLSFVYRDANNAATAVAANVRSIQITLNGVTSTAISGESTHGVAHDTLGSTTRVALRNTLR